MHSNIHEINIRGSMSILSSSTFLINSTRITHSSIISIVDEEANKRNQSFYQLLSNNWDVVAPTLFHYERGTPRSNVISQELRGFYFNNEPITEMNGKNIRLVRFDLLRMFRVHMKSATTISFPYRFTQTPSSDFPCIGLSSCLPNIPEHRFTITCSRTEDDSARR